MCQKGQQTDMVLSIVLQHIMDVVSSMLCAFTVLIVLSSCRQLSSCRLLSSKLQPVIEMQTAAVPETQRLVALFPHSWL